MGLAFESRSAGVDEYALGDRTDGADPEALVRLLGEAKGAAVARAVMQGGGSGGGGFDDTSRAAHAAATDADSTVPSVTGGAGAGASSSASRSACTCVLTGDQVVVRDGKILEKPKDDNEARAFIAAYSGGECSTVGSCTATGA